MFTVGANGRLVHYYTRAVARASRSAPQLLAGRRTPVCLSGWPLAGPLGGWGLGARVRRWYGWFELSSTLQLQWTGPGLPAWAAGALGGRQLMPQFSFTHCYILQAHIDSRVSCSCTFELFDVPKGFYRGLNLLNFHKPVLFKTGFFFVIYR